MKAGAMLTRVEPLDTRIADCIVIVRDEVGRDQTVTKDHVRCSHFIT